MTRFRAWIASNKQLYLRKPGYSMQPDTRLHEYLCRLQASKERVEWTTAGDYMAFLNRVPSFLFTCPGS